MKDDILEKDNEVKENPEGRLNPQFDYKFIEGLKKNNPHMKCPLETDDWMFSSVLDKLIQEGNYPDSAGHEFGILGEPGMFKGQWREAPTDYENLSMMLVEDYAKESARIFRETGRTYEELEALSQNQENHTEAINKSVLERFEYIQKAMDEGIVRTSIDSESGDVNMTVNYIPSIDHIDISVNLKKDNDERDC